MKIMGLALAILGVLALLYGGINFNRNRTVLQMGSMSVTATEHRNVPVPAVVGAAMLIGGVLLVVASRRRTVSH
jgi:uncharacterized membrane protein YidH (DUF202 family)